MATRKLWPKQGGALVVCLCPDICLSPDDPAPYQTYAEYSDHTIVSSNVRIRGAWACNTKSRISGVLGNDGGTGGGVISGTFMASGWTRPCAGQTPTLHVNKAECLRHADIHFLNCGGADGPANTVGKTVCGAGGTQQAGVAPDGTITSNTNPQLIKDPAALNSSSSVGTDDLAASTVVGEAGQEAGAAGGMPSLGASFFQSDLGSAMSKSFVTSPGFIQATANFAASKGDPRTLVGFAGTLLGAAGISGPLVGPAITMVSGLVNGQNPILAAAASVLQGAGVPTSISGPAIALITQATTPGAGSSSAPAQQTPQQSASNTTPTETAQDTLASAADEANKALKESEIEPQPAEESEDEDSESEERQVGLLAAQRTDPEPSSPWSSHPSA